MTSRDSVSLTNRDRIRQAAEADLEMFIKLIHPNRVLGNAHREVIRWWTRGQAKSHQLLLFPRDHQKSALLAYRVAWTITKNPSVRILYISATSNLAIKQLKFIKDILTSDSYRYYWPEMVNREESKREKWTETEISVDHPYRKAENVRDPTVFACGLTTTITGLHCDIACADDVVIDDNAYSEDTREDVRERIGYLTSILATDGELWSVGTRYHPKDLYNDFMEQVVEIFDDDTGEITESYQLFEIYERAVEDRGDGTGQFLWPKQQRNDGKWYGFDKHILARKKAGYLDKSKFFAQYYNNPNDSQNSTVKKDQFQYYNKDSLNRQEGRWFYKDRRLNIFAAIDFAFSLSSKADFTSIVVVGVDIDHNYYILDIERFKTNKISEYFDKILKMHIKWGFRKIRAEVIAAQEIIVQDLKQNYIRPNGLALSVEHHRPTTQKEERMEATLQPRYNNLQIYHFVGGMCDLLEEELILQRPAHDDIKDALTSAIEISIPPTYQSKPTLQKNGNLYNARFGGIGILAAIITNSYLSGMLNNILYQTLS